MATFGGGGVVKQAATIGYVPASNEYAIVTYYATSVVSGTVYGGNSEATIIIPPGAAIQASYNFLGLGPTPGPVTFTFLQGVVFST